LTRVDGTLTGLDAVAGGLAADTAPRAYLLSLDPAGDGRAILAIGNPDHADNVLTYVPGMSSCLPAIEAELGRADRMAARCAELGPTEQTATVLWLDYDAPDFLDEAMRSTQAEAAGPALHRFQEGLRASHDAAPAYQTVLGHSYGSLVVGAAARDHGLAADSLVFVGSPGVGVDHAADLTTPDVRIWSTTARDDPIQYGALGRGEVLGRLATAVALPLVGFPLAFGRPGRELWFGRNPSDAGFGARIFSGDARGHMGYWETGNPALDGMARIALGTAG
jgi:pimeloyl-ACP methyl ester carboxylesterase